MSVFELISQRRSVRKFLNRPIPKEDLQKCLEAARLAPSACNCQPWTFVVVDDPALKDKICEKAFSGMYSMNQFVKDTSALIAVVSEKQNFFSAIGGQVRNIRYYLIDIGIACEHLILQATELGIGSCWIGWFNEKPVKTMLKIPFHKKVDVLIALGYDDDRPRPQIRKSIEEISSYNLYRQ